MPDLVTRTITITVTARPQDFEGHPSSEDTHDDLICLLTDATSVTLDAVTTHHRCPFCGADFFTADQYDEHLKVHDNEE